MAVNLEDRPLASIIEENGKRYYIDGCRTPDHGWEILVCEMDGDEIGKPIYMESPWRYKDMLERYAILCNGLFEGMLDE